VNAAPWAFGLGREEQAQEVFLAALNLAIGDAEPARAEALQSTTARRWRERLQVVTPHSSWPARKRHRSGVPNPFWLMATRAHRFSRKA
jgi:hypothetical protein